MEEFLKTKKSLELERRYIINYFWNFSLSSSFRPEIDFLNGYRFSIPYFHEGYKFYSLLINLSLHKINLEGEEELEEEDF